MIGERSIAVKISRPWVATSHTPGRAFQDNRSPPGSVGALIGQYGESRSLPRLGESCLERAHPAPLPGHRVQRQEHSQAPLSSSSARAASPATCCRTSISRRFRRSDSADRSHHGPPPEPTYPTVGPLPPLPASNGGCLRQTWPMPSLWDLLGAAQLGRLRWRQCQSDDKVATELSRCSSGAARPPTRFGSSVASERENGRRPQKVPSAKFICR